MKILYLTHALPKYAGDRTTVFVRELALAFKNAGHDITVLAPSHPELDKQYQSSLFDFKAYRYFPLKQCEVLGYGQGMSDGLHQNKLNFILGPFLIIFGIFATILTVIKKKPDLIFANWGIPDGFIGAVAAFLLRKKLIITYIGADVKIISSSPVYSLFARFSASVATVLTTNGADLKNELVSAGIPDHKIHFVIYGANAGNFKPDKTEAKYYRKKLGFNDNTVVIGSIGRFIDKKGFEYFIESAPHILNKCSNEMDVKFALFGAGENEEQFKLLINNHNLDNIFFLPGPAPPENLSKVYNCIDIFTNPAVRKPADGLNVVVVEAMACAKPIVATNACGNELVIQDGINGFLVPEMTPEALAEKISTLIVHPEMRQEMGNKSRELFLNHFTWDKIVSQYCSLVEQVK